jgi:serine/threonine-protein kinase RsbW
MVEGRFPRSFDSLAAISTLIDGFAVRENMSPDISFDLQLAVEELFTNLVKHHPESREPILLQLERVPDGVRVTLEDFGVEPWDIAEAVATARAPLPDQGPGGRGLRLVRLITDEIRYQHDRGHSTITLIKKVDT